MAKNTNPFGMIKSDIDKLSKLVANSGPSSLDVNFMHRSNPGTFRCGACNVSKNQRNVANVGNSWFCLECVNPNGTGLEQAPGCSPQPHRTDDHKWGIRLHNGSILCIGCNSNRVRVRSVNANSINVDDVVEELHNIESGINKRVNQRNTKKKATLSKKAAPYMQAGLAEPFALAIARGVDDGEVMDLWESDWWKQYPADDDLIVSVLKGEHAEDVARTINEFRGEHPELAHACIVKDVKVDWATMLLDAGFDEHPEAVVNVLCGGDPPLVARIRQMKVDNEGLPPGVGMILDPIQLEAERKAIEEDE